MVTTRRFRLMLGASATALSLLAAAPAVAGPVEGGVFGEMGYFGSNRSQASALQNWAPRACVGVVVQSREGWRVGGELGGCFSYNRGHIGGAYLGPRFGYLARLGAFRIGTMAGFGMGVMDDRSEFTGHRFSTYLYAKPAITMGVQLGGMAIEGELYAMLPIQIVQLVHDGSAPSRIAQTGIGFRVGLLFGKSPKRLREEREAELAERAAARQAAIEAANAAFTIAPPPASSEPAGPPVYTVPDLPGMPPADRGSTVTITITPTDTHPLAIPAPDAPPPREGPPPQQTTAQPAPAPASAPPSQPLALPVSP